MWTVRLVLCVSSETYPADFAAKLPTTADLIRMDFQPQFQTWHAAGLVWLGARAYLKLGQEHKAEELATAGVAKYKNSLNRFACHQVLAEIAHGRGDAAGAERAYSDKFGLRTSGRRNALGCILGERNSAWLNGTAPAFSAARARTPYFLQTCTCRRQTDQE